MMEIIKLLTPEERLNAYVDWYSKLWQKEWKYVFKGKQY
jgi:hypothetical protein